MISIGSSGKSSIDVAIYPMSRPSRPRRKHWRATCHPPTGLHSTQYTATSSGDAWLGKWCWNPGWSTRIGRGDLHRNWLDPRSPWKQYTVYPIHPNTHPKCTTPGGDKIYGIIVSLNWHFQSTLWAGARSVYQPKWFFTSQDLTDRAMPIAWPSTKWDARVSSDTNSIARCPEIWCSHRQNIPKLYEVKSSEHIFNIF